MGLRDSTEILERIIREIAPILVTDRGGKPWTGCIRGWDDKEFIENQRNIVQVELLQRDPPIVLHDFDDELHMAKWCEAIWPCEKMIALRESIENERRDVTA